MSHVGFNKASMGLFYLLILKNNAKKYLSKIRKNREEKNKSKNEKAQ